MKGSVFSIDKTIAYEFDKSKFRSILQVGDNISILYHLCRPQTGQSKPGREDEGSPMRCNCVERKPTTDANKHRK